MEQLAPDATVTKDGEEVACRSQLLKVENLKVYFRQEREGVRKSHAALVRAVDDVTFSVHRGETLGLVGESGCGKSTLARAIVQLCKPTEGSVVFEGRELTGLGERDARRMRRQIQMIFQDPSSSLNPRRSVGRAVGEGLEIHGIASGHEKERRVRELFETVGLNPENVDHFPHQYSGGQKQRIGIARALALRPKFIVCDEPTSALDVSIKAQIINLLVELQAEFDLTYLFISHDLGVIRQMADRVAVMYVGKFVEVASRSALFSRPLHPYTQSLLSAIPVPDPELERSRQRIVLVGDAPSSVHPPSGCRFHTRCPFARQQCRDQEPPLLRVAPHHFVACHFWDEIEKRKVSAESVSGETK